MTFQRTFITTGALSLTLLFGCATSPKTDAEFGNSVRQTMRGQKVFVPVDETPVAQGDGQRLEGVLDGYREGGSTAVSSGGREPRSSSIVINAGPEG